MGIFSWLLDHNDPDNTERGDRQQDAGRKLDGAMPMAGAGAELSGKEQKSETEKALQLAANRKLGVWP